MKKLILRQFIGDRLSLLRKKIELHSTYAEKQNEITKFQIDRFNLVWPTIWKTIPFYNFWKRENKFPIQLKI